MKQLLLLSLLLISTSCNFKPKYCRPEVDQFCTWRFDNGCTKDESINIRWWEQFNDPILNALILTALDNNQDLQVAKARVLEFYAKFRIVASQLYPQVALDGSYLREELTNAISYAPLLPSTRVNNLYNLAFMLSYELDVWGQLANETEAAVAEFLSQVEVRRTVVLTLVSAVASAYVTLRQFDNQLDISKKTYATRVESLKLSTLRFEVGLVSEMEVKQAQSQADEALAQVKRYEELIPQQENLISVLLGAPPQDILRGPTLAHYEPLPCVPAGIPSDVLRNRPDILNAELQMVAANANIGVARAAFFPSFTLTGLYGAESTSLRTFFQDVARTWNIGLGFTEPLLTGWRLDYQLREAEAVAMETIHGYQQTVLTAFKEVEDALIANKMTKEIVVVQTDQVAALSDYYKLAMLRYENGQNDYLTVLDAERALFRVQLDLAEAQANVFLSLIDIYKALGGGWVIDADLNLSCHADE